MAGSGLREVIRELTQDHECQLLLTWDRDTRRYRLLAIRPDGARAGRSSRSLYAALRHLASYYKANRCRCLEPEVDDGIACARCHLPLPDKFDDPRYQETDE